MTAKYYLNKQKCDQESIFEIDLWSQCALGIAQGA